MSFQLPPKDITVIHNESSLQRNQFPGILARIFSCTTQLVLAIS